MLNTNILDSVIRYFFLQRVLKNAISNKETKIVLEKERAAFLALGSAHSLSLTTEDHVNLEAIYIPGSGKKVVFICSGGLESYEKHSYPIAKAYWDEGFHVLVFNYRGFGNNKGEPTVEGLIKDARAAYLFLEQEKGFSKDDIIGHGYSLGGGVVAQLAEKYGFKIVIDRSFTRFSDIIENYMKKKKRSWLSRVLAKKMIKACFPLDTLAQLKKLKSPVFIFRGIYDLSMSDKNIFELKETIRQKPFVFVEAPVGHFHDEKPVWLEEKSDSLAARKAWLEFVNS